MVAVRNVLYIGWIGYNNLGDDLMFDLFKHHISMLGEGYKLDVVNNEPRFLINAPIHAYDLIVLGGGSIISGPHEVVQSNIIETLYHALKQNKKTMIWGSGIDWIAKSYITREKTFESLGKNVSPSFQSKVKTVFEESMWAGVRGPLTLNILKSFGIEKKLHISGDPAFLLNKPTANLKHKNHDKIIGVNWGTSYNNIYGNDEEKLANRMAKALNQLIYQGYKVYFYIVWGADIEATKRLYDKIENKKSVIVDEKRYNEHELMQLMQQFSFTINFKLHANYLSLIANVPFIALGYRFKVFDFIESIQLEEMIISTDDEHIVDKILHIETMIEKDKKKMIETMNKYQSFYRKQLMEPFENQLYLN